MDQKPSNEAVDRFILEQIESVPHLEALFLLRQERTKQWSPEEVAQRLFVPPADAEKILNDLVRQGLAAALRGPDKQDSFAFRPGVDEALLDLVDLAYRRELVRISTLIHSKASKAVREFARAFRINKERE